MDGFIIKEDLQLLKEWGGKQYSRENSQHHKIGAQYKDFIMRLKKIVGMENTQNIDSLPDFSGYQVQWQDQAGRGKKTFSDYIYFKFVKNPEDKRVAGPIIIFIHMDKDGFRAGVGIHDKYFKRNIQRIYSAHEEQLQDIVAKYREQYSELNLPQWKVVSEKNGYCYMMNNVDVDKITPNDVKELMSKLSDGYNQVWDEISEALKSMD